MAGPIRGDDPLAALAAQLLAAEAWNDAVVDVTGAGLIAVDGDGLVAWVNDLGAQLAERPPAECVGRPVRDLIPAFPTVPEPDPVPFAAWVAGPKRNAIPIELTVVRVRRGGDVLLLGGFHGIAGLLETEQQLRESEGRFTALVTGAPDGLVVVARRSIVFANPAMAAMLGAERPDRLVGRPLEEVVAPAVLDQVVESVREAFSGEVRRDVELPLVRPDGVGLYVDAVWVRIEFEGGPAVLGMLRDTTGLRQMRVQLAQADRLASLGLLAAGVAHEVNNPLSYVLHHLERLVEELEQPVEDPTELGAAPAAALDGANRIQRIARGLTTFARVDRDEVGPCDVVRVVEDAVRIAAAEVRPRARLVLDLDDVPAVIGASGPLAQVFLNLVINAAHSIEPGRPADHRIDVLARADLEEVRVSIADTGSGIEPAVLPRLFEPFFTTKPPGVGSGLGLSICQRIIDEIGGRIDVQSTVGVGTTVTIILQQAGSRPESAEWRLPSAGAPQPLKPSHGRLLLVDDDPAVLDALARVVKVGGHDVVAVQSGEEALARISDEGPFDLVLTDLMMDGLSGIDLYEALGRVSVDHQARVVFVTGGAYAPEVRAFLAAVDNPRLRKPVDARELLRFLDARLGANSASGE